MSVKNRIKRTRRYQRTEFKILMALYEILQEQNGSIRLTDRQVYRRARIRPSSFYLHYKNVDELLKQNHDHIIQLVEIVINQQKERSQNLCSFLRSLLICISQNHLYFGIEYYRGSHSFESRLTEVMHPIVTENWSKYDPRLSDKIYQQYCAELVGILQLWAEEDFSGNQLNHYLFQLVKITEMGAKRYLPLCTKS